MTNGNSTAIFTGDIKFDLMNHNVDGDMMYASKFFSTEIQNIYTAYADVIAL